MDRMNINEFPDIDDVTMVKITKITDSSVVAELLEYGNMEAHIKFTELSRKRIRSVGQHAKVDKVEPMTVISIDELTGYIDLSKKYIQEEEIEACTKKYYRSKSIYSIVWYLSEKFPEYTLLQLNELLVWPLYKDSSFSHPYFAFQAAQHDFEKVFPGIKDTISKELLESLQTMINQRFKRKPIQLNAVISLTCLSKEGINTTKRVLREITNKLQTDTEILSNSEVKLIRPPYFSINAITYEKSDGTELLTRVISEAASLAKSLEAVMEVVTDVTTNNPNIVESESDNDSDSED